MDEAILLPECTKILKKHTRERSFSFYKLQPEPQFVHKVQPEPQFIHEVESQPQFEHSKNSPIKIVVDLRPTRTVSLNKFVNETKTKKYRHIKPDITKKSYQF